MTKNIIRKSVAIFSAVAVIFSCCFVTSFAAENVAKVGDTEYDNLQDALNNADGQTVTLLKSLNVSEKLIVDSDVTLDLNDFKLTSSSKDYALKVNPQKTFTIKNGTLENTVKGGIEVETGSTITVEKDAIITANGSTVRSIVPSEQPGTPGGVTFNIFGTLNSNATGAAGILSNGEKNVVNVDGATINFLHFGVYQNGSYGGAKVTVKNSTVTDLGNTGTAVYVSNSKSTVARQNLIIENSEITGSTAVEAKYTDVTINGDNTKLIATGEPVGITVNNNGAVATGYALALTHNGTTTSQDKAVGNTKVSGGDFNGAVGIQDPSSGEITEANMVISGGSFSEKVNEEYLDASVDTKATYTAVDGSIRYIIGERTLKNTLNNMSEGDKIVFEKVAAGSEYIVPEGVEVTNSTGADMTINNVTVADGVTAVVKEPEPTDPSEPVNPENPQDKPSTDKPTTGDQEQTTGDKADADKESDSPKTGDDTMVLGYVIMMLAALGIGGTLVVNRKKN